MNRKRQPTDFDGDNPQSEREALEQLDQRDQSMSLIQTVTSYAKSILNWFGISNTPDHDADAAQRMHAQQS